MLFILYFIHKRIYEEKRATDKIRSRPRQFSRILFVYEWNCRLEKVESIKLNVSDLTLVSSENVKFIHKNRIL